MELLLDVVRARSGRRAAEGACGVHAMAKMRYLECNGSDDLPGLRILVMMQAASKWSRSFMICQRLRPRRLSSETSALTLRTIVTTEILESSESHRSREDWKLDDGSVRREHVSERTVPCFST